MHNIRDREYEQFTPPERINLTMAALARGDFQEADRLYDSCPTFLYKVRDLEYNCRLMAIPAISHLFYEQCVYYYNILVKIDSTILLLEATGLDRLREEDSKYNKMHERHDVFVSRLKALYEGFLQFCDQVELDGAELLKTMYIEHTCFAINEYLNYDVVPVLADTEAIKTMFLECWQC